MEGRGALRWALAMGTGIAASVVVFVLLMLGAGAIVANVAPQFFLVEGHPGGIVVLVLCAVSAIAMGVQAGRMVLGWRGPVEGEAR